MSVPHHQDPHANPGAGRDKRYPLPEPSRKIIHAVHDSGIYLFKVGLVLVLGFVGCPHVGGCAIIQSLVENSMGRREGVHIADYVAGHLNVFIRISSTKLNRMGRRDNEGRIAIPTT